MVYSTKIFSLILLFTSSLFFQGIIAELTCEGLPPPLCSFAIASSGKRCVLENYLNDDADTLDYTCKTSEVVVETLSGYIENDVCVRSCGVDRQFVGISSDALLTADFTARLCSPACYQNCPNIVDLYFNLAAGEGVHLPTLCEKHKSSPRRAMIELLSSGGGVDPALSPASSPLEYFSVAPTLAPAPAPATF